MKKTKHCPLVAIILAFCTGTVLQASVIIWTEDFTGFLAGSDYTTNTGLYTLLADGDGNSFWDPNTAGTNNVKVLQYSGSGAGFYWGAISGTPIVNDTLKPQVGTNTDFKGAGVFLNPSLFTAGSGTYTLSYDVVGTDATNSGKSAGIQVATFSGVGVDSANTVGFDVAGNTLFTNPTTYSSVADSRFGVQGTATAVSFVSQIVDTTSSGTFTMDFSYNVGEVVGIVVIGYATDVQFDNLSVTAVPEPRAVALMAGLLAIGVVLVRRRRAI